MKKAEVPAQQFANIVMTDTRIFTVRSSNKDWVYNTDTMVRIKSQFADAEAGEVDYEEGKVLVYVRTAEKIDGAVALPCEVKSTREDDSEEDWGEDDEGEWK